MAKELDISKNFIAVITSNWQSGDLIVVSSRPWMGKTRFLLSIIQSEIFQQIPVEFISIDCDANINQCFEECIIKESQYTQLTVPFRSIADIKNHLVNISKNNGIKYVFIDNVNLISETLSDTLIQLKTIAKELSIIVITTIPLDKAGKKEHVKPSLSALKRKIPIIERLADFIFLIHRPIYYTYRVTEASLAEIIIAKNRDGKTGYFSVCLNKESHIFEDYDLSKLI